MTSAPLNNGRKTSGRFAKGNSLGGKTPGARHRVTRAIEELLEGEHEALTRTAIDKALTGDVVALRLCLDRLAPPRKDSPIAIDLPAVTTPAETVTASALVLAATASGSITPDEAGRIMALLTAHRTILETADLAARVAALEERK